MRRKKAAGLKDSFVFDFVKKALDKKIPAS